MKGANRDGVAARIVEMKADTFAEAIEPIGRTHSFANTDRIAGNYVVGEGGEERALGSEIMAGQGAAVSSRLAGLVQRQGVEPPLRDDDLGGLQNGALSRLATLRLRLARRFKRVDRIAFYWRFPPTHGPIR